MKLTAILPSLLLGGLILLALHDSTTPASAKTMHMMKAAAASPAMLAEGKAMTSKMGCTNCHGADLAGKKGFAPSLHASGVLKEYNKTTFERVMNTGVTNDGGMVQKPMPVYHLPAAKSDALYAYLKTLK